MIFVKVSFFPLPLGGSLLDSMFPQQRGHVSEGHGLFEKKGHLFRDHEYLRGTSQSPPPSRKFGVVEALSLLETSVP